MTSSAILLKIDPPFFNKSSLNQIIITGSNSRGFAFTTRNNKPVDCKWKPFSGWSSCSKSCESGVQIRERAIDTLARRGGQPCRGDTKETRSCNTFKCPRMYNKMLDDFLSFFIVPQHAMKYKCLKP
jgi:hypothetical protein